MRVGAQEDILVLVRHARTAPVPELEAAAWRLAESATDECRRLADELRPLHPDRIITSDHHKAEATGALLARYLGLPRESAVGLEEHDRSGVPFYEDPREFVAKVKRLFDRPEEVVLGQETAEGALERYEAAIRREAELHGRERLILVSHATVMALLVARHNEVDGFEFWKTLEMPEALVLRLEDFALLDRLGAGGASNEEVNR
ncbi:MAG TPA: histidine phosphatase family protein [Trueperaceae bacterium]